MDCTIVIRLWNEPELRGRVLIQTDDEVSAVLVSSRDELVEAVGAAADALLEA